MELNDYKTMEDQTEAIELAIKTCLDYSGEESKSAREYLSQIMLNDSYLLDDYLYSSDCNLEEVVNIDIVKKYILGNSCSFSLEEFAENGYQWAFDLLDEDGGWMSGFDWEYFADFIVKCYANGVDTGKYFEVVAEALDHDEYTVNLFAENGLYKYLDRQLPTYSWIEECLRGNDDVAIIAEKYLTSVFRHKNDLNWLKNQADAKIPQAQYLMGLLHLPNDLNIVKENPSLALRYLKAARDGGCSLADARIKELENEQKEETDKKEKQKQQDKEQATNLTIEIQKAENGELSSEDVKNLASMLAVGNEAAGIKKNSNKATKLYRIAAKQGNSDAMFRLGVRMIDGEGCRKNWNAGMQYIRKAAKAGNINASRYVEIHDTFINRMIHKIIK